MKRFGDVTVDVQGVIGSVELRRPPHNFFDKYLIENIADAFEWLDSIDQCRTGVLQAEGTAFCAGGVFQGRIDVDRRVEDARQLYTAAARLFRVRKPIIAAIEGAAIGGGLGLAMAADFRVASERARFSANFTKLGIHPGFGLTLTLPRAVGQQVAASMFLTGERVKGGKAAAMGLVDHLVDEDEVRPFAHELAGRIAECAPLAIEATRATLRRDLADRVEATLVVELDAQEKLFRTLDFAEGVTAVGERREARFTRA